MKEKIKNWTSKKYFHISMLVIMIVVILFIVGIIMLRYNVEGETNMPFTISKITILSSVEGVDKENAEYRWAFNLNQNNDIYLYIDKNSNYSKVEAIQSVVLDHFTMKKEDETGEAKIFKLEGQDSESILKTKEENATDRIEFVGEDQSNLKQSKITNQGGLVVFRCSNYKIGEYLSNEEEIIHNQLLQKAGILKENLKIDLNFDVILKLQSGKEFKANVSLNLPTEEIVEKGTDSKEITELENLVFKRTKN